MPLNEEFDRYYAETQRGQGLELCDPGETIQSKLPVEEGELILTQTRLYLAVGDRGSRVPNVRLRRAAPRAVPEEGWLEVAPRMGAHLLRGQTGSEFLAMVEERRQAALERVEAGRRAWAAGVRRRYERLLERARGLGREGKRRQERDLLRDLHAAVPERREAAVRLGDLYLEEGNHRAAAVWLAAARAFDARFDAALARVERPRLPSREHPAPEWWIDRHLTPLLDLPEGDGAPDARQRERIRNARERIARFRRESGRPGVAALAAFVLAVGIWFVLLMVAPWVTLGVTAVAAAAVGLLVRRRQLGRRAPRR